MIVMLTGIVLMGKNTAETVATNQADKLSKISDTASKSDLAPYVEQQIYGSEMLTGIQSNIQDFNFIVHVYSYEKETLDGQPLTDSADKYTHKMVEIVMPRNNSSHLTTMQDYTSTEWVNPHAKFSGQYLYDKHQEVIGVEFFQQTPYMMVDFSTTTDDSLVSSLENAASEFIKEYIVASDKTYNSVMKNGEWIIPYERKTYDLYKEYGGFLINSAQELNRIYNSIDNTGNNIDTLIESKKCLLTYFNLAEVNGLKSDGDFSYSLMGTLMIPRDLTEQSQGTFAWDPLGVNGKYAGFNFMRSTSGSYPYYILKNWKDETDKDYYGLTNLVMYGPKEIKDYEIDSTGIYNYDGIEFSCSSTYVPAWLNNVAWQSVSKSYLFNDADKKLYDLGKFFNSQNLNGVISTDTDINVYEYGWQGFKSPKIAIDGVDANDNPLTLQKINEEVGGSKTGNYISATTDVLIEYHRFSSIMQNCLNKIRTAQYQGTTIGIYDIDVEDKAQLKWASNEINKILHGTGTSAGPLGYYGLEDTKEQLKSIYNRLVELNKDVVYLKNFCKNTAGNNEFPAVIANIVKDIEGHSANCTKGASCDIRQQLEDVKEKYVTLADWNNTVYTLCETQLEPYIDNSLRLIASMIDTTEVTGKTSTDNNYNDFIDALITELEQKKTEYDTRLKLMS